MTNTADILKVFRQIASEGRKVRLLNLYKGIPISYAASILNIGEASVTVRTEKIQLVCMYRAKETFIQNVRFPHLVRAGVVLVDAEKINAMLTNFSYQPERIGDLTQVRIQPGQTIPSVVVSEQMESQISGELADVSLDGVAVMVHEPTFAPGCRLGDNVNIQVQLPRLLMHDQGGEDVALELHGVIANVKSGLPGGKCRIGIELSEEDTPARAALAHFVTQRQTELLREIRSIYELVNMETKENP